ncbi:GNAT family N-acetyltransferase [Pedobacter lithocola]|uniref:GNAT family N-acetyltransferase n=1 Tax=Pedobacter lithocola TaxID=1908239 RepID=A0ABV8PEV8_9SPHI
MKIFVETERLYLREIIFDDAESMFDMDSNAEVHAYLGNLPCTTLDECKVNIEFIRRQYIQNGIGRWAIIEKESEKFIGWPGFKLITETYNNQSNYYDIGYRLIKRYWGKGYATEAAKAVIDYGFSKMELSLIIGIADIENTSSIKVLEKIGLSRISIFNYNGRLHHWMKIENGNSIINSNFAS